LSGAVVAAAFGVVFGRDIIKSGLFLILALGGLAGIYVMLGAAIVAGAQVLVYIGAISVLILFAIMLTQSKVAPTSLAFQTQVAPAAVAAVFSDTPSAIGTSPVAAALFGPYLLAFEIASVLILAAVIGGVYLAMEPRANEGNEEGE
jgi:NADH-quinone oxidoreductase subunit J